MNLTELKKDIGKKLFNRLTPEQRELMCKTAGRVKLKNYKTNPTQKMREEIKEIMSIHGADSMGFAIPDGIEPAITQARQEGYEEAVEDIIVKLEDFFANIGQDHNVMVADLKEHLLNTLTKSDEK